MIKESCLVCWLQTAISLNTDSLQKSEWSTFSKPELKWLYMTANSLPKLWKQYSILSSAMFGWAIKAALQPDGQTSYYGWDYSTRESGGFPEKSAWIQMRKSENV